MRNIDWNMPFSVVVYLRMSSDRQNPRSPDQQLSEIKRILNQQKRPWKIQGVYRDDAISGRYVRRRPEFQRMLKDIKAGGKKFDLILVDTSERIGRNDQVDELRRDLEVNHGVLILEAKNGFADPTTSSGRLFTKVDTFRATQENEIKAHQVRRGKIDAVERGLWPGGPPPFGFRLETIFDPLGSGKVIGTRPVPDPQTAWIAQRMFQIARERCWGQDRVTRFLRNDPEIPQHLRNFHTATIGRRLKNPLYMGKMIFNSVTKKIVEDIHVVERNPSDQWIIKSDFCTAIVSPQEFQEAQLARLTRAAQQKRGTQRSFSDGKLLPPVVRGQVLKNFLSGLVVCAECKAAMHATISGTKSKSGKSYSYYTCPLSRSGMCSNRTSIPVEWLEKSIITHLRTKLFGF
ncbi:recombinase family protein [Planctomicrobium sp. SH527]|uniref:recombinase family protein n=1 Tax=Planctomicrobium sp. SH527 TaxID=3448123 RepID=UPI003F5B8486